MGRYDYILTNEKRKEYAGHLMPAFRKPGGFELKSGKGIYLEAADGKRYIDFTAGMFSCILGYGNEEIAEAIYEQAKKLTIVAPLHQTDIRYQAYHKIASIAPKNLNRISFSVGGGSAIESAMKIAMKNVENADNFVTMVGGYHGTSMGAISATFLTSRSASDHIANPAVYDFARHALKNCIRVPRPYMYRNPFEGTNINYIDFCVDMVRQAIINTAIGCVAGIIVEPVQSAGGQIDFSHEYLRKLRDVCDEFGILLIFDEIQTYARTNQFFAAEYYGVEPDIIVFAKGVGGGIPIAGIIIHDKLRGFEDLMEDMHTFQNNHLSYAAALKAIEIIERDHLLENVEKIGDYYRSRLHEMQTEFPEIGDIRGPGLAIGVEMVADPVSKKPLSNELLKEIFQNAIEEGLFIQLAENVIKIKPAIIISREEAEESMDMLEKAFRKALRK